MSLDKLFNIDITNLDTLYENKISDPTSLLLHLNGSDGTSSTSDSSGKNHSITFHNDAQLDTAQKKFGISSLLLDGDADYITTSYSTDFDMFTSTNSYFTIDFFVKHNSSPGDPEVYFAQVKSDWINYIVFQRRNDSYGPMRFAYVFNSTSNLVIVTDNNITDTNWHHIAICIVNNTVGIYIDGIQESYGTFSNTTAIAETLSIGSYANSPSDSPLDGWIDEFRMTKSNPFGAAPNSGKTDTITVPTSEHSVAGLSKILGVSI